MSNSFLKYCDLKYRKVWNSKLFQSLNNTNGNISRLVYMKSCRGLKVIKQWVKKKKTVKKLIILWIKEKLK